MKRAGWPLAAEAVCWMTLLGCGASEPARAALEGETHPGAGATRAERERAAEIAPPAAPAARADRPALVLSRVEGTAMAEDGTGELAPSEHAIAVDLRAGDFPPRALDPELTIGALRFTHYHHPRPGVLRYLVARPELLVEGSEVAVTYRGDDTARTVVSESLTIPVEVR